MDIIAHPSSRLKSEWIDQIRNSSAVAEMQGSLTDQQLELIYEQSWFKLFVPRENSTSEISLPDALRLEETLSWADGSLGWTVTLCSGAGWFSGFFGHDLRGEVFKDPKVCLGGSGAPTGTATKMEDGYLISGRWKYATGAAHLTHFTANCMIKQNDEVLLDESGKPLMLPFIFTKDEVNIIREWCTIGLIATSSESFEINNLHAPASRCFKMAPEAVKVPQAIYRYPFLQFAEVTLAVNISGMAIHFVDCCRDVFSKRINGTRLRESQHSILIDNLRDAEERLSKVRSDFFQLADESWQVMVKDALIPEQMLKDISITSRMLASTSHEIVNTLYPLCGLAAANPSSEINRVWRDLHTASQHSLLTLS